MFNREFTRAIRIQVGNLSLWPALPSEWTGHAGSVNSVSYSPNGALVVTGLGNRTIGIWDSESGAVVVKPLTGHRGDMNSVAYSPDGRHIISRSINHTT